MKILIESIPHKDHRYATCGDWFVEPQQPGTLESTLRIRVSEEMPWDSQCLVALHELAEYFMCKANAVTQQQVDEFDMNYEANRKPGDESEPGDQKSAPYFAQHGLATGIERIVATQMGVVWPEHEAAIGKLFEEPAVTSEPEAGGPTPPPVEQ